LLGVYRIGPAALNYADGPAKEQYRSRFESVAKLHNLRDTSLEQFPIILSHAVALG
jgi:hypothetical protein